MEWQLLTDEKRRAILNEEPEYGRYLYCSEEPNDFGFIMFTRFTRYLELPPIPSLVTYPEYAHLVKVTLTHRNSLNECKFEVVYMDADKVDDYVDYPPNLYKVVATPCADIVADMSCVYKGDPWMTNDGRTFTQVEEFNRGENTTEELERNKRLVNALISNLSKNTQ